jgi:hypothetical protein
MPKPGSTELHMWYVAFTLIRGPFSPLGQCTLLGEAHGEAGGPQGRLRPPITTRPVLGPLRAGRGILDGGSSRSAPGGCDARTPTPHPRPRRQHHRRRDLVGVPPSRAPVLHAGHHREGHAGRHRPRDLRRVLDGHLISGLVPGDADEDGAGGDHPGRHGRGHLQEVPLERGQVPLVTDLGRAGACGGSPAASSTAAAGASVGARVWAMTVASARQHDRCGPLPDPRSGRHSQVFRRDRLDGLLHEYAQVA